MKFSCSVTIKKPLNEVVSFFKDEGNLAEWQDNFLRKELISGTSWEVGAVSMIYLKIGKGEMKLKETILENSLPLQLIVLVEHKHMVNTMRSKFSEISETSTKYEVDIEYTKFIGIMPKLMAFLFPGMFKKQVQKWLDNFKKALEK